MKNYIQQKIENIQNTNQARCIVREYLQARTLECLQENHAFVDWAFVGGTALRFLYDLPRFSEDLDFSIKAPGVEDHFEDHLVKIKNRFIAEDYDIKIKAKTNKTVRSAFIKFRGLLYELGLSPLRDEVISIKVEIDSNPPVGAILETTIVRRHCLLNLQHYDKGSLLAGKLHALSSRKYTKGRDVYDLMWYLLDRKWPAPNIELLNNAHRQSQWAGEVFTKDNWRDQLALFVSKFEWNTVITDIKPFVEKQSELDMLTRKNILKLLESSK